MNLDRRAFLGTTAAVPLLFGLRELLADDTPRQAPDWYARALRRMKETGRLGVVVVVPDGEEARLRAGRALWILANEEHPEAHELFAEAVFVCMTSEVADAVLRREGGRENRLLVDGDGKRAAADAIDPALLESPARFAASFRGFLHGESNDRLREQAARIGRDLTADLREAVVSLDADDAAAREASSRTLLKHADRIAPYLAWLGAAGGAERSGRARDVLRRCYAATREDEAGPRLPYGAVLPEFTWACNMLVEGKEAAIRCGLASVPAPARKFIRFMTK
jgi:hypothetical protein